MARNPVVESVLRSGTITDAQTLELRRYLYADYKVGAEEADWLFEINDACKSRGRGWDVFFIEALSDYIVHQMQPQGYVNESNVSWLMQRINTDGKLDAVNELELLIAIFEIAKSVPDQLEHYALQQVKTAVLEGTGTLRNGQKLEPGIVSEADVQLLRRILYAYASGNSIGITRNEAEILFDINDATAGKANHPSWSVLFAQAIANHLMMHVGHTPLSRETVLRQEQWLENEGRSEEDTDFISSMVSSLREIYQLATTSPEDRKAARRIRLEAATAESETVTDAEAQWLLSRINRDGQLSEAETAALAFIKRESLDIHPALQPLLDKVA